MARFSWAAFLRRRDLLSTVLFRFFEGHSLFRTAPLFVSFSLHIHADRFGSDLVISKSCCSVPFGSVLIPQVQNTAVRFCSDGTEQNRTET